jgi:hypothetical protein
LLILWCTDSVTSSGVTSTVPGNKVLTICERSVHTRLHTTKLTAEGCHIVVCSLAEADCLQRVRNLFAPWDRTRPNCHSLKGQSPQTAIIKTHNTDTDVHCAYFCSARTAELRVRGSLTQYVGGMHDINNIMVAMYAIRPHKHNGPATPVEMVHSHQQ